MWIDDVKGRGLTMDSFPIKLSISALIHTLPLHVMVKRHFALYRSVLTR
jgi:hypothetical protein